MRAIYPMRARSFTEYLQNDSNNHLISHANFILTLRQVLPKILPSELAQNCSVANYKDGKLVIFAHNNAVAAKLKLLAGGLPRKMSEHLQLTARQVTAVTIEVQPQSPGQRLAKNSLQMSQKGAEEILEYSSQVSDISLRNALLSLASRARK
ncbi:MAG: DciA family protein [Burkholderiales bacterium]